MPASRYIGRFAPSPTGPLHAGSLVAALASWLDARAWNDARGGTWLVRIEDVDRPRCPAGATERILAQLQACSLLPDAPPVCQSRRTTLYDAALDRLRTRGHVYACVCSRKDIADALARAGLPRERHGELIYPGTCRAVAASTETRRGVAWRMRVDRPITGLHPRDIRWTDRRLGPQRQDLTQAVGDFVLRRADDLFGYQLAVVVDDADQDVTHVVRGEDLADNTARQIWLQHALEVAPPLYLHTPLVLNTQGEKLSKQSGAAPVDTTDPLAALAAAAAVLDLPSPAAGSLVADALANWVGAWRAREQTPGRSQVCPHPLGGPDHGLGWGHPYNPPPMHAPLPSLTDPADAAPIPSAPAGVAHPRAIRSFVRRAGRTTEGQARALADLGPRFLVPYAPSTDALAALYPQLVETRATGPHPPLVLEIGFGMGEATAQIAQQLRGTRFLCCEVHEPGVGALLKRIGEMGLTNVRIVAHDAVEIIDHMLPVWDATRPACGLDGVHIFFPDPWHKTRHHKRRLIQPPLVARLASRLKPGAYLHCATDWQPYAEAMLEVLAAEPLLRNRAPGGYAPRPDYRPLTKFERRGVRLGHGVWDLVFERG